MAYCGQEGKDRIIFVTKEDHETPSSAELVADDPNDPYEEHGLILRNGDINWNCPCLAGMASGPCGEQFKSAFSCFHCSTEDLKGSDCAVLFQALQECMQKYPDLYPQDEEEEEEEEEKKPAERLEKAAPTEATQPKKRRDQANEGHAAALAPGLPLRVI
ncbi:Mitochondrial intermembrane space import and assembly protein 40 [Myotis brandtii]|uniref:Mitochondrial intermembrane space import and assembly protein 40 n=1 Tax=Myotis brandtii TaxID=109478 RepID=S7NKC1_MYOBR|nr:Mitochondrial intermembrane space import and assembly protein 40 [Myotis brandtii]